MAPYLAVAAWARRMASACNSLESNPPRPSGLICGRCACGWPLAPDTAPLTAPFTAPVTAPTAEVATPAAAVITFVCCGDELAEAGRAADVAPLRGFCTFCWAHPAKRVTTNNPPQPMLNPKVPRVMRPMLREQRPRRKRFLRPGQPQAMPDGPRRG